MIINPEYDPMGHAIDDFFHGRKVAKLRNATQYTDEDEFPVAYLFRTWNEMPPIEQHALQLTRGRVLDVGAAAGCHSLYLQEKGFDVTSIDNSQLSVSVMAERGVSNPVLADFYTMSGQFDTLLFLMNGIGICGTLEGLPHFFDTCRSLLRNGGQILFDSSDIIYLFTEDDGSVYIDLSGSYYGEVIYTMRYKKISCKPFPWLYVDFNTLLSIADACGFKASCLREGEHYDYLAKLEIL